MLRFVCVIRVVPGARPCVCPVCVPAFPFFLPVLEDTVFFVGSLKPCSRACSVSRPRADARADARPDVRNPDAAAAAAASAASAVSGASAISSASASRVLG